MADDARVLALLDGFAAAVAGDVAAPPLTPDDAAAIAGFLHRELDRGAAARDRAAAEMGHPVACREGCAACCRTIIVTGEADARLVATWLAARAEAREGFAARHRAWRAAAGDLVDRAAAAGAAGDHAAVTAVMGEATARGAMCPFNDDGRCAIYPVRPAVCRAAHAVDTADECRPGGRARGLDFVPITRFLARLRTLDAAMNAALPGAPRPAPLADRVAALLDARA